MAPGATTMAGPIPRTDITSTVFRLAKQAPLGADIATLKPQVLQGAMSQILGKALAGINFYFDDLNLSVKDTQILELLLGKIDPECRLNLPQGATALYYLLTLRTSGVTPDPNDNMIHVRFSDLRAAANDPRLQSALCSKIQDGKYEKLFARNTLPPAVAPGIGHNPAAMSISQTVSIDTAAAPAGGTIVHDPIALLRVAIEDPSLIETARSFLSNG